jgi:dienelactone hydrolase
MKKTVTGVALAALLLASATATVQAQGAAPLQPFGRHGGPGGSGPLPAIAESIAALPTATLYHPLKMPRRALPLLLWGNGGCRDNGLRYAQFLREVASQGYFIIAAGHPRYERPVQAPGTPPPPGSDTDDGKAPVSVLRAGLDWATQATADRSSAYYGRIDTTRVGVMGTSCGGLQSIAMGTDARVDTVVGFNTGVLNNPPPDSMPDPDLLISKATLSQLKGPIAYINGGPTDIAYENALDDFARIGHVPVFFGENGVGHGGTYQANEYGGSYARVATHWFNWQLKGDARAARWFTGADCELCTRPGWRVRTKNFPAP